MQLSVPPVNTSTYHFSHHPPTHIDVGSLISNMRVRHIYDGDGLTIYDEVFFFPLSEIYTESWTQFSSREATATANQHRSREDSGCRLTKQRGWALSFIGQVVGQN